MLPKTRSSWVIQSSTIAERTGTKTTVWFCIDCGAELLYLAHIGLVLCSQIGHCTQYIATKYIAAQ